MTRGGRTPRLVAGAAAGTAALLLAASPPVPVGAVPPDRPAAASTTPADDRPPVGAGALRARITSMVPAIPEAGDTLVLRGTVANTSPGAVDAVTVALRLSPTPLPSRGEIPEVLAGAGTREGLRVSGATAEVAERLDPGQSAEFELRAAVDDLGLSVPGAYVTGAEALGSTGAGVVRQDLDRTFLPWWPEGTTAAPLLLTTLWPVVGPPLRDARGALLTEEPAVQMSPTGRLATLVEAAAARPGAVTVVLDPQSVDAAAAMSGGYEVRAGSELVPGRRSTEVTAWLESVRQLVADPDAQATALLYGWPDVVAARRGRLLGTLLGQRGAIDAATADALGVPLPAEVALVPGGAADPDTLSRLARGRVGVTVLSDQAVQVATPSYFTPSGSVVLPTPEGDLPVLVTDKGLSQALAMPLATPADRTAARQRLLAETLVTVMELPETERLLVAAPDPTWSPPADGAAMVVGVAAGTPWIQPTGLAAALGREPSSVARTVATYGPDQQAQELPEAQVGRVRGQFRGIADYAEVVTDAADVPAEARTAPTRGLSAWFRDDPAQGAALVDVVSDQVDAALGSVRVVSSGSITVSGTSGTIPVTVENAGPVPVTVGLAMISTPPQLFDAEPVDPFRIDPQRRTSIEVTAQVAGAGPIPVRIQLTTVGGEPFGVPGELVVQSTAYANAARVLVRAALAALILAVVVHGVRRARRRRTARPTDDPPTTDPPEVAHD